MNQVAQQHHATFEAIRRLDEEGNEFWLARQLAKVLDYSEYRHFLPVLERAREACHNSAQATVDHFEDVLEMVRHRVAAVATGLACTLHHGQEVAVLRVVQHLGQRTGQPELVALVVDVADALEGGVVLVSDGFVRHLQSPPQNQKPAPAAVAAGARSRAGGPRRRPSSVATRPAPGWRPVAPGTAATRSRLRPDG